MKDKSTEELLSILNKVKSRFTLKQYVDSCNLQESNYEISEYILNVCESKGFRKSDIIKNASIYRTYGYEILNGKKTPSRDKLIKICIGNGFNLDQANRALTIAKLGILYAKNPRDSIMIYALNNRLNIIDTNFILSEHDFKLLGYN